MKTDKTILDACCGSRMFWFDKNNPNVLFADIRKYDYEIDRGTKEKPRIQYKSVKPDILMDFRNMPFADNTFNHIVFDPPHLNRLGKTSYTAKNYGVLLPTWAVDIKLGFDECMRVLKPNGTLIFKWNESQITSSKILSLIPYKPLYGHTTGRQAKTIWMAFMKLN
jgi:ubiquinone/menaquinone biosynthesis C-methylase UbiE